MREAAFFFFFFFFARSLMYSKGLMQLCDYTSFVEELQQDN